MMGLDIFGCELVVTSVKFSVTKYDPGLCEITATTEMNIGYIKKNFEKSKLNKTLHSLNLCMGKPNQ